MSKSMYAILGAWDKDIQEDKKLQTNIAKTIDYLTAAYDSEATRGEYAITKDMNSKYISYKEAKSQNTLLESLLKINDE